MHTKLPGKRTIEPVICVKSAVVIMTAHLCAYPIIVQSVRMYSNIASQD